MGEIRASRPILPLIPDSTLDAANPWLTVAQNGEAASAVTLGAERVLLLDGEKLGGKQNRIVNTSGRTTT